VEIKYINFFYAHYMFPLRYDLLVIEIFLETRVEWLYVAVPKPCNWSTRSVYLQVVSISIVSNATWKRVIARQFAIKSHESEPVSLREHNLRKSVYISNYLSRRK